MVLLWISQGFSQIDKDSVYVVVEGEDTLIKMHHIKARKIASQLIERDSLLERCLYLEEVVSDRDSIIKGDSLEIERLNLNILMSDEQLTKKEGQLKVMDMRLNLQETEAERFKRQRWWWGVGGLLIGTATGIIIGVTVK